MASSKELEINLKKSSDNYKTDYRRFKINNIIAILSTIRKNPGIKLQDVLSICNVSEPFMNKKTAFDYIKDMIKAKQITMDMKTRELNLCD